MSTLADEFARHARTATALSPAWAALLDERVAAARAAWPAVTAPVVDFVRALAARYPGDLPVDDWLRSLHVSDLYLAWACSVADTAAVEAFATRHLADVARHVAHLRPAADFLDELRQELRTKLLVARDGAPPRIAEYQGLGPLDGGWLRVVAVRAALDLRRRRGIVADASLADRAASRDADPELGYLDRRYRPLLQECLTAAVGRLTADQRNLLRMHVVDGVTLEQLARLFHVGRATVVRRLAAARAFVVAEMRARVQERLAIAPAELDSLMGELVSRLDLSLSTVL